MKCQNGGTRFGVHCERDIIIYSQHTVSIYTTGPLWNGSNTVSFKHSLHCHTPLKMAPGDRGNIKLFKLTKQNTNCSKKHKMGQQQTEISTEIVGGRTTTNRNNIKNDCVFVALRLITKRDIRCPLPGRALSIRPNMNGTQTHVIRHKLLPILFKSH